MSIVNMEKVMSESLVIADFKSLWCWFQGSFDGVKLPYPHKVPFGQGQSSTPIDIPRLQTWTGEIDDEFILKRLDEVLGDEPCYIYWPADEIWDTCVITLRDDTESIFIHTPDLEVGDNGTVTNDQIEEIIQVYLGD